MVLVGETRSSTNIEHLKRLGWGRMWTERTPSLFEGERWGFDNGAFVAWKRKESFPVDAFQRRLDAAVSIGTPMLAVCPDIVANGCESLPFSLDWIGRLPSNWPWYLAVQDGMVCDEVQPHLKKFSGIFLGGSDKFKAQAYRWCKLAHSNGLKFHYGRAGTPRKLLSAFKVGADSVDSAFPLWTSERMKTFGSLWEGLDHQIPIEGILG